MKHFVFKERNEIISFKESYPEPFSSTISVLESFLLSHYYRKYKKYKTGSEKWHKTQERLCSLSSVGLDAKRRVLFYKATLPKCGENLYVHPSVALYFPNNIYLGNGVYFNFQCGV